MIVNDGGEDISDVLSNFPENDTIQIKYVSNEKPSGRSNAANQCLENANGHYSIFLDDDDWFAETHIEGLVKTIETENESVLSYTGCVAVDENRVEIREYSADLPSEFIFIENFITTNSYLFKTELGKKCKFESELLIYEDWDFLLQLYFLGKFVPIKGLTAYYEITDGGSSDVHNPEISRRFRKKIYEKWCYKLPPYIINFLADEGLKGKNLADLKIEIKAITNFLEERFKDSLNINLTKNIIPKLDCYTQLFINNGKGFDEINSIRKSVNLKTQDILEFIFDLSVFRGIKSLRFDPLNIPNVCEILKLEIFSEESSVDILKNLSDNAYCNNDNTFYFQTSDSAIIIRELQFSDIKEFKVVLKYLKTGEEALNDIIEYEKLQTAKYIQIAEENFQKSEVYKKQIEKKQLQIDKLNSEKSLLHDELNNLKKFIGQVEEYNEQLKKIIYQQEYEYFTLINSRTWKIMGVFRNIKSFMKKLLKNRK